MKRFEVYLVLIFPISLFFQIGLFSKETDKPRSITVTSVETYPLSTYPL